MSTVDEYLEAQRAEWSQYVAAEAIFVDGARAFNAGDPVPASHVDSGVVSKDQVTAVKRTAAEKKGN